MKTPPVKFRFVVLAVIAIVAVVSCTTFPIIPGVSYCLQIGATHHNTVTYVKWKSQGQFDAVLQKICNNGGTYDFNVLIKDGGDVIHHYHPCNRNVGGNIRTVRVIKSKAADRMEAGAAVPNDPNVTWRVASSDPADIKAVLDSLQP